MIFEIFFMDFDRSKGHKELNLEMFARAVSKTWADIDQLNIDIY